LLRGDLPPASKDSVQQFRDKNENDESENINAKGKEKEKQEKGKEQEKERGILEKLLLGYERMLYLMAKHPHRLSEFSPPAMLDLFWHAHLMHPKAYINDMLRSVGAIVDHQPWPDMSKKAQRSSSSNVEVWSLEFPADSYFALLLDNLIPTNPQSQTNED